MQTFDILPWRFVYASAWCNLLGLPVFLELDVFLLSFEGGTVDFAACIFLDISFR